MPITSDASTSNSGPPLLLLEVTADTLQQPGAPMDTEQAGYTQSVFDDVGMTTAFSAMTVNSRPIGLWRDERGTPTAAETGGTLAAPHLPTSPSDRRRSNALRTVVPNTSRLTGLPLISGNRPIRIPLLSTSDSPFERRRENRRHGVDPSSFAFQEKENIPPVWLANPRSPAYRANPNSPTFRISTRRLHSLPTIPWRPAPEA